MDRHMDGRAKKIFTAKLARRQHAAAAGPKDTPYNMLSKGG